MSWRVIVISQSAKLDFRLGYLVVRQETTQKIHLSEIHTLVLESTAITVSAALLCELVKNKVKVIFCDEKRNPLSELLPYYGSHDTSAKIRSQIHWRESVKSDVWTAIVGEKIFQQAKFLRDAGKRESELLSGYLHEMKYADQTNREGHAAKVYFNALFGIHFTRGSDCAINAALNYGYAIILSAFTREIAANGYLTQLGLFHDNMFNPFNLASDLMEPFRVLVDRKVYAMSPETFGTKEKRALAAITGETVNINGRTETVLNAVKLYCKSVFDAIENEDINRLRFYK